MDPNDPAKRRSVNEKTVNGPFILDDPSFDGARIFQVLPELYGLCSKRRMFYCQYPQDTVEHTFFDCPHLEQYRQEVSVYVCGRTICPSNIEYLPCGLEDGPRMTMTWFCTTESPAPLPAVDRPSPLWYRKSCSTRSRTRKTEKLRAKWPTAYSGKGTGL